MQENGYSKKVDLKLIGKLDSSVLKSVLFWTLIIIMCFFFIVISIVFFYHVFYAASLMPQAVSGSLSDTTDGNAPNSALVSALVSQQSNTLAIVAIAATWLSIIIAMVSVYQSRKLKYDSKIIEKNIEGSERYKKMVSDILSLLTIRLFHDVYTFGASAIILQELRRSVPENDIEQSITLHLAELSEYESSLSICENNPQFIKAYEGMYTAATQLLQAKRGSLSIAHFAYIKAIFSQYRIVRILEPENPQNALHRIDDCFHLIKELDALCVRLERAYDNVDDSFGHMENLHGLVYLWYVRIHAHVDKRFPIQVQKDLLKKAVNSFTHAIDQGVHRKMPDQELVKFHNHKIATLLNLLFKWQEEYSNEDIEGAKDELKDLYKKLDEAFSDVKSLKMPDNYPKIGVNYAHYITTKIRIHHKKEHLAELRAQLADEEKRELETVLDWLQNLISNRSTFVDVFYWHASVGFLLKKDNASVHKAVLLGVYYQSLQNGKFAGFDENIKKSFENLLSNVFSESDMETLFNGVIWQSATLGTLRTAKEILGDKYKSLNKEIENRGLSSSV